ncbi:uncharacterized protein PHALS_00051 [Plasmopara halstedii]|uniref:Uncharacterized protein n=1 Tax=Plasmopara halstedii TaxID=4781 RepID=A0A0P1A5C1_PLAHL|nr:uncharacterized protein PHALS_00051 [Plasmopara halstedii]CEG35714.1 hypothetical protein PHALS_00051 [Plasmopara halstedii]|eukprot:XP_024572083.1 hypothetical protein PHALS_00051 [Plasmopara halstedii]
MMIELISARALLTTRWHVITGSFHHPFVCIKNKKQQKERSNKWRLHLLRPKLSLILYPGICRPYLYISRYVNRFRRPSLQPSDNDGATSTSDSSPIYDDSDDDSQHDQVSLKDNFDLMNETVIVPVSSPSAPVWAKAAKNRRALSAVNIRTLRTFSP